jgi:hypothetical protein
MRDCCYCEAPLPSGQGEPCAVCNGWFHFDLKQFPRAAACGIVTDRFPGLIS